MKPPQFNMRDLLIAMSLLSVGAYGMTFLATHDPGLMNFGVFLLVLYGSFAITGAGVGWPIRHPIVGGVIGCAMATAVVVLLFVYVVYVVGGPS